jgi:hypothetical protein
MEGTRGYFEPIARFIANESLGRAQLYQLIDDRQSSETLKLPRRTAETVGAYIRWLFGENNWLDAVTIPAVADSIHGLFGLAATVSEITTVTLADAGHRPKSSRKRA